MRSSLRRVKMRQNVFSETTLCIDSSESDRTSVHPLDCGCYTEDCWLFMDSTPSLISQAVLSCMCASTPAGAYGIGCRETDRYRAREFMTLTFTSTGKHARVAALTEGNIFRLTNQTPPKNNSIWSVVSERQQLLFMWKYRMLYRLLSIWWVRVSSKIWTPRI